MSEARIYSPSHGDEGRELFERRYPTDPVMTSMLRIDATLHRIRRAANSADLNDVTELAEQYLAQVLHATSFESAPDLIEYYHLKIKHAMIRHILFSKHVFDSKDRYDQRRELINGTYGIVADVLEEALTDYDSLGSSVSTTERSELTGVINELTALALLNRSESSSKLAIPSEVTADLYHATDLEYYVITKRRKEVRKYHIQVKSSPKSDRSVKMPIGGILLTSANMNNGIHNGARFRTARAIVGEVNARNDADSDAHLAQAVQEFSLHLASEVAQSDNTQDAYELAFSRLPADMRSKLESTMRAVVQRVLSEHPDVDIIEIEIPKD